MSFPDGVGFYPDVQGGVRGYNTDAARGADTFIPFKNLSNMTAAHISYGASYTAAETGIYILAIFGYSQYGSTYNDITGWPHTCTGKLLLKKTQPTGRDVKGVVGYIAAMLDPGQKISLSVTHSGDAYKYEILTKFVCKLA